MDIWLPLERTNGVVSHAYCIPEYWLVALSLTFCLGLSISNQPILLEKVANNFFCVCVEKKRHKNGGLSLLRNSLVLVII